MEVDESILSLNSLTRGDQLKLYQLVCLSFEFLRLIFLLRSIGFRCCTAKICWDKDDISSCTVEHRVKVRLFI